jgi:hypothetical protein
MAGTGKSTISRTIAGSLADQGLLGASFFFKRGEGDRGNASRVFTTIAAQLVVRMPELTPPIVKALERDPTISDKAMKEQFEKLVFAPLSTIHRPNSVSNCRRIVIVIDALDECEEDRHSKAILHLLSRSQDLKGVSLRIFVTSRPDLPIRLGFQRMEGDAHQDIALHEIPDPIIEHDLRAFLQDELARIRQDHSLPPTWPNQADLQTLVEMARPLFIFAATVCRFVDNRRLGDPRDRLAAILTYKTTSRTSKLDSTYLPVLNQLLIGLDELEREEVVQKFREIVGTIVTLVDPLSTDSIAKLLEVSPREVDYILEFMHSVLRIPADRKSPIRLLHLSFRDFLLDKEKRRINPFWIDEKETHKTIAANCIQLMSKRNGLRENICGLQFPGKRRSDVKSEVIETFLPPETRYACRYWAYHLQYGQSSIRDQDSIHIFLQVHFLHWLEALSLLGKVSESITIIKTLQSLLQVRP